MTKGLYQDDGRLSIQIFAVARDFFLLGLRRSGADAVGEALAGEYRLGVFPVQDAFPPKTGHPLDHGMILQIHIGPLIEAFPQGLHQDPADDVADPGGQSHDKEGHPPPDVPKALGHVQISLLPLMFLLDFFLYFILWF